MSDNLNERSIGLEDIYAKLEELVALQKNTFREIIHIANSTSSTQIMLTELSRHLGLAWDDDDEDDEDEVVDDSHDAG